MKRKLIKVILATTLCLSVICTTMPILSKAETNMSSSDKQLCVGYYPYYGDFSKIKANSLTHLNFAFGYIYHNETLPRPGTYDWSKTSDPALLNTLFIPSQVDSTLKRIPELKKQNPKLKTLLSIGGWGGRGFCDASSTKENRVKLANSIKDTLNKYGLDGVDIDWECPVNGGWGEIKGCPDDKAHYSLLAEELRNVLGDDKLITIAAGAGWDYRVNGIDWASITPNLDFINVMTYAYSYGGPKYDAPLYNSTLDPSGYSTDQFMKLFEQTGVPKEKLVVGTPFFGKIPTGNNGSPNYISKDILNKIGLNTSYDYGYAYYDIIKAKTREGVVERWDDEAKTPYLVYVDPQTKEESFIISYDNIKTQLIKGRYVKDKGYGGIMIWDIAQDNNGDLMNAVYNGLYTNFSTNKLPDITGDSLVDIKDLSAMASTYNKNSTDKDFIENADLNDDKVTDIYDLTLLSRSFSSNN